MKVMSFYLALMIAMLSCASSGADLENENNTIRAYRERVKQCEALGEYAIAEDIREILRQEQEHQIDLATALGEEAPDVSKAASKSKG